MKLILLGAIRRDYGTCVPAAVHRVQLSAGVRLVDRNARFYVPLPVQRILPLHIQSETRQSKYTRNINFHIMYIYTFRIACS